MAEDDFDDWSADVKMTAPPPQYSVFLKGVITNQRDTSAFHVLVTKGVGSPQWYSNDLISIFRKNGEVRIMTSSRDVVETIVDRAQWVLKETELVSNIEVEARTFEL